MPDRDWTINHILLADDDEDDKIIFNEVIKKISPATRITYVNDGNEALASLKATVPDIIFLDLNMPLKGGLESLTEIRQNPAFEFLPIIIYSTSSNRLYIDESYNKGANCYIVKPYTIENITTVVEMILDVDWKQKRSLSKEEFLVMMPS